MKSNNIQRESKEMRRVYRDFLAVEGVKDSSVVAFEADLSGSMATADLKDVLNERYVNVGIMEAQMIGAAAGMSVLGYKPYIHTFGPFATRRVYDQVFLSLAYSKLPATIIGSDAGVSAETNGGTHMPFEDLSLMRAIPHIRLYEVSDDVQFQAVLKETLVGNHLNYIRTIRKNPYPIYEEGENFSEGYKRLRKGKNATIVASGMMVEEALKAADSLAGKGVEVGVIDLFRIKPLNLRLVEELQGAPVVTAENHNVIGGLGGAISELMSEHSPVLVKRVGVQDEFGQVGTSDYLKEIYGLTAETIQNTVQEVLE